MINLVELLASGLGVKLGEPFDIVAFDGGEDVVDDNPYSFTKNALVDAHGNPADEGIIDCLVTGDYAVSKYTIWDSLKLCYVYNSVLYFTDRMSKVTGDDWDDAPYQHNAEEPYEEFIKLRIGAYGINGWNVQKPRNKGSFSVKDINKGAVPWLYTPEAGGLYGGASVADSIVWLQKAGCEWGELHK